MLLYNKHVYRFKVLISEYSQLIYIRIHMQALDHMLNYVVYLYQAYTKV